MCLTPEQHTYSQPPPAPHTSIVRLGAHGGVIPLWPVEDLTVGNASPQLPLQQCLLLLQLDEDGTVLRCPPRQVRQNLVNWAVGNVFVHRVTRLTWGRKREVSVVSCVSELKEHTQHYLNSWFINAIRTVAWRCVSALCNSYLLV